MSRQGAAGAAVGLAGVLTIVLAGPLIGAGTSFVLGSAMTLAGGLIFITAPPNRGM